MTSDITHGDPEWWLAQYPVLMPVLAEHSDCPAHEIAETLASGSWSADPGRTMEAEAIGTFINEFIAVG